MNEKNIFGFLNSDGSIASWPEADLNGFPVNRDNATRAQVDASKFVVVPVNVEFNDELRTALLGGYSGLQEWRSRTVLAPVVGFTVVDDNGNPIAPDTAPMVGTFTVSVPPIESFVSRKNKGASDDHS
jgi:hypothetical protein